MPKMLADARIAVWALTEKPADLAAVTVEEINAGKEISCQILKSDYQLGATGDNTISEPALCVKGEGQSLGSTTYGGNVTVYRYYDETGKPNTEEDFAFDLFKERGATFWLVEREGPEVTAAVEAGQEYSIYEVQPGAAVKPSNRSEGNIKRTFTLAVQAAEENRLIVGAGA